MNIEKSFNNNESLKPKTIDDAVELLQNNNIEEVINFLKEHKDEVGDFCLSVKDHYKEGDTTTPILILAQLIRKLL